MCQPTTTVPLIRDRDDHRNHDLRNKYFSVSHHPSPWLVVEDEDGAYDEENCGHVGDKTAIVWVPDALQMPPHHSILSHHSHHIILIYMHKSHTFGNDF